MNRFQNILVYVPREVSRDEALDRAVRLAARTGARVRIAGAVKPRSAYARVLSRAERAGEAGADEVAGRLDALAASSSSRGVEISTEVLFGDPAEEIVRRVLRDGYDLVLKTARPEGEPRTVFFGATAARLLRLCPSPVWIVRPRPSGARRVLVLVEPCSADPGQRELDARAMGLATEVAREDGAELHAVAVWDLERMPEVLEGWSATHLRAPRELESMEARAEAATRRALVECLEPWPEAPPPDRVHLVRGDLRHALPGIARDLEVDVLVLGTHPRVGFAGFRSAGEAESILPRVSSSILAIKPADFETSVHPY